MTLAPAPLRLVLLLCPASTLMDHLSTSSGERKDRKGNRLTKAFIY